MFVFLGDKISLISATLSGLMQSLLNHFPQCW